MSKISQTFKSYIQNNKKWKIVLISPIFILAVVFIVAHFVHSGAILTDGDFDASADSADLRTNGDGYDWYESRAQAPELLTLDETTVGTNSTKKAKITGDPSLNTYLSQELSTYPTESFIAQWDIYIDEINDIDAGNPDRTGLTFFGDDSLGTNGPNSTNNERWMYLAWEKDGGGTTGPVTFAYRDADDIWTAFSVASSTLSMREWYTVKIVGDVTADTYDIYIDDQLQVSGATARYSAAALQYMSFASWNDGTGTFYVDNVSVVINAAPVVTDIPNQTVYNGESFTTISLDSYVSDDMTADADISWGYSGNTTTTVSIVDRVATITYPEGWTGAETVTFTATDGHSATDSDTATFTINSALSVSTEYLDFSDNATTTTFTITNNSGESLDWTSAESASWITSLSPSSGTLAASDSVEVTVNITREHNCRMWGALSETDIPDTMMTNHLIGDPTNYPDSLKRLGSANQDGWGLISYDGAGATTTMERNGLRADTDGTFNTAATALQAANPKIAFGHVRNGSSGCGGVNVDDPHPFYRTMNSKNWSFIHNGTIDKTALTTLLDGYHVTNPPNCSDIADCAPCASDDWVDSELWFLLILKHIEANGWIVEDGLLDAIDALETAVGGTIGKNFILSDGYSLWAYRMARDLYYLDDVTANDVAVVASVYPSSAQGNWVLVSDGQLIKLSPGKSPIVLTAANPGNLHRTDSITITAAGETATITSSGIFMPTATNITPASLADSDAGSVDVDITFNSTMNTSVNPTVTLGGLDSAYTCSSFSWDDSTHLSCSFTFTDDGEDVTGNYSISGAKDALGNTMLDDALGTVTVDTENPTVAITNKTTNDSTPSLSGTTNDTTATFSVLVDGQTKTPTNNGDDTWTLADGQLVALDDGIYNVAITATDSSSNTGTDSTSNELMVDTTAPSGVGVPTFGTIASSSIAVVKPVTVTEALSGLNTWQARRDGSEELGQNATTTTSVTDSGLTENTQYTYDAQFVDVATNESSYGTSAQKYTLVADPTSLAGVASSRTAINISVDAFTNPEADSSGYYFANTTSNTNSGWIQTNSWSDTSLTCGTSYNYTVKYRNGDGTETSVSDAISVSTSACAEEESTSGGVPGGGVPSSNTGQGNVTQNFGGTVSQTLPSGIVATVNIPSQTVSGTAVVVINPITLSNAYYVPSDLHQIVGNSMIDIQILSDGIPIKITSQAVEFTFTYSDEEITTHGLKEKTIKVYYWDKYHQNWAVLVDSVVDTVNNTVTATTQHFSLFAIMGSAPRLVKTFYDPKVYIINEKGYKRHIPSEAIFLSYCYFWDDIKTITPTELNNYPDSKAIKIWNSPKVYQLTGQKKQWIPDEQTFNDLGYDWSSISEINITEYNYYTIVDHLDDINTVSKEYIFSQFLQLGYRNEEVMQLQIKLKDLGYFNYPHTTGYFGPVTKKAVQDFQAAHGIRTVGWVGPQTRVALNSN